MRYKLSILSVFVLGLGILSQRPALAATELDGTQWKMKEKKPLGLGKEDMLRFEGKKFTSMNSVDKGFNAVSYETNEEGDKTTWTARQQGAAGEPLSWQATAIGGKMSGEYTRRKGSE